MVTVYAITGENGYASFFFFDVNAGRFISIHFSGFVPNIQNLVQASKISELRLAVNFILFHVDNRRCYDPREPSD